MIDETRLREILSSPIHVFPREIVDELCDEIRRLHGALVEFGQHYDECPFDREKCDCGLEEAINGGESAKGGDADEPPT